MEPSLGRLKLRVVGLGPGSIEQIPKRNVDALQSASIVLLRTEIHPAVRALLLDGISYQTCDDLYEGSDSFEELYLRIAERAAALPEDAVYAVPGHPMVGEESVRLLSSMRELDVYAAPSFVDAVLAGVKQPFSGSMQIWNAHEPSALLLDPRAAQVVYQVDSEVAASDVKLHLLRRFPDDHVVFLAKACGTDEESIEQMPLCELDRKAYDPLTSVYVPAMESAFAPGFEGLVGIVDSLLGPDGCPWDREQTHDSLKKHMLEETYEVLEAIDAGDPDALCEELGDFLLQAVMHAQMDAVEGLYDIDEVVRGISDKLIRRHPHVFGDLSVRNSDEVLANWDAIKAQEKGGERSALDGVPRSMPALLRAHEVSKRAVRVGFEWQQLDDVFAKMDEETAELRSAMASGSRDAIASEIGDLLFTIVNIARWLGVEPEDALRKMIDRFSSRFRAMESLATKPLAELDAHEWDVLWNKAKRSG